MSQCSHCLLRVDIHGDLHAGKCPNCGHELLVPDATGGREISRSTGPASIAPGPGSAAHLLFEFFKRLRELLFNPSSFFERNAAWIVGGDGLSSALAFAVIVHWFAAFFNFFWRSLGGLLFQGRIEDMFRIAGDVFEEQPDMSSRFQHMREIVSEFFFGAGAIVLDPFFTLGRLALTAAFIHLGVRFFIQEQPDRQQSYKATLKILAFAAAPAVLAVIPGFGMVLSWMLAFLVSVIGIRTVYRSTTGTAIVAVLFPKLAALTVGLGIVAAGLFVALSVFRLVF